MGHRPRFVQISVLFPIFKCWQLCKNTIKVYVYLQATLKAVVGGQEVCTVVSTSDLSITRGLVKWLNFIIPMWVCVLCMCVLVNVYNCVHLKSQYYMGTGNG